MNSSKDVSVNTSKIVDGAVNKDVPVKKKNGPKPVDKKELELFKQTRGYRQIQAFCLMKGYSPSQTYSIVRKAVSNQQVKLSDWQISLTNIGLAVMFIYDFTKEGRDFWFNISTQTMDVQ